MNCPIHSFSWQLLISRQTYITLVTDKVQKHFKKFTDVTEEDEMWCDYEGQSLKW